MSQKLIHIGGLRPQLTGEWGGKLMDGIRERGKR